jgi:hypothetical protein
MKQTIIQHTRLTRVEHDDGEGQQVRHVGRRDRAGPRLQARLEHHLLKLKLKFNLMFNLSFRVQRSSLLIDRLSCGWRACVGTMRRSYSVRVRT